LTRVRQNTSNHGSYVRASESPLKITIIFAEDR
jgi:hypothetical protein